MQEGVASATQATADSLKQVEAGSPWQLRLRDPGADNRAIDEPRQVQRSPRW